MSECSLEHLSQCHLLKALLKNCFYLPLAHTREAFFVLAEEPVHVMVSRAIHLHVCKSMFDFLRHNGKQDFFKLYRAQLLKATRGLRVPPGVRITVAMREDFVLDSL